MHVARKGDGKRQRKNTDKKHDSDEDSEDDDETTNSRPSSSHQIPVKRKVSETTK